MRSYCILALLISFHLIAGAQVVVNNNPLAAIQNPVINSDFPDPTVINSGGRYYAYATQTRLNKLNNRDLVVMYANESHVIERW